MSNPNCEQHWRLLVDRAATIFATALACDGYQPQHAHWMRDATAWLNVPRPPAVETLDEPPVMGAGTGPAPMPPALEAIEAHVRQIQILCDATGRDPTEWLSDNAAQGETGDRTQLHGALVRVVMEAEGCPPACSHEFHKLAIASVIRIAKAALSRTSAQKESADPKVGDEVTLNFTSSLVKTRKGWKIDRIDRTEYFFLSDGQGRQISLLRGQFRVNGKGDEVNK